MNFFNGETFVENDIVNPNLNLPDNINGLFKSGHISHLVNIHDDVDDGDNGDDDDDDIYKIFQNMKLKRSEKIALFSMFTIIVICSYSLTNALIE